MTKTKLAIGIAVSMGLGMPLVVQIAEAAPASGKPETTVPVIGCASDGQTGPREAPASGSTLIAASTEVAGQLAYYKAEEGTGVLAPRGWHCFGIYGSDGATLYVSASPLSAANFLTDAAKPLDGPVVALWDVSGDTSGRFEVAKVIARVFPAHRKFADAVIAEGIEPASDFPSGPYPADRLKYRSDAMVEFRTAAGAEGLGTVPQIGKGSDPMRGVAALVGKTPDLMLLSVRLPSKMNELTTVILAQAEKDAAPR